MDERIGIEIEQVVRTDDYSMPRDLREAAVDMLTSAGHAANGAPDKPQAMAEAVQSMAVYMARRDRCEMRRIQDVVLDHAAACPMAGAGRIARTVWQYRRHITAVAGVALGSFGLAHATWMVRLVEIAAKMAGVE